MSTRLLSLIAALALFVTACGGSSESTSDESVATDDSAIEDAAVEETAADDVDEATIDETAGDDTAADETAVDTPDTSAAPATGDIDGQAVYEATCARCHGSDGAGGRGPTLIGVADKRDIDSGTSIVTNGGSNMPSFGEQLSEEEIIAVVDYAFTTWPAS